MRYPRVAVHALLLALANLGCILLAFGAYLLLRPPDQVAFQGPLAALLSVGGYLLFVRLLRRSPALDAWNLKGRAEFVAAYLGALVASPLVFVPLHYLTQGYLTALSNLTAIWLFQLPTNLAALLLAHRLPPAAELAGRAR